MDRLLWDYCLEGKFDEARRLFEEGSPVGRKGGEGGASGTTMGRGGNDVNDEGTEAQQHSHVFPDLRAQNPDNDNSTALHVASHRGHVGIVQYLLVRKADIEAQNARGYTPLFEPILQNRLAAAQLLIEQKANVEASGSSGKGQDQRRRETSAIFSPYITLICVQSPRHFDHHRRHPTTTIIAIRHHRYCF